MIPRYNNNRSGNPAYPSCVLTPCLPFGKRQQASQSTQDQVDSTRVSLQPQRLQTVLY